MYFTDVILPLALPRTFTYSVNEDEYHFIKPGMRIVVPFGKSKMYTALVLGVHQIPPQLYEAKAIHQIVDEEPLVNAIQFKHWQWIADYYMCSLGEVYRGAMPTAFLLESETILNFKRESVVDVAQLTDDEYLIFEALQNQSSIKLQDAEAILNKKRVFPVIQRLLQKNVLHLHEEVQERYKPKLVKYIRLHEVYMQQEQLMALLQDLKGNKQKEAILMYFQLQARERKPIAASVLKETAAVSDAVLKSLVEKGIFETYSIQEERVNFEDNQENYQIVLSTAQQAAFDDVNREFLSKDVVLLHGITGSGKTEIYIKLIEDTIAQGKQVLYLLPEIALTTQLVTRLTRYFGNKVSVFHSKYSNNERVEVWNNLLKQSENAQIVIGARSALFLPFSNLGLLLVDEEHEQTFKQQDPAPRYHARDAAIVLAQFHQAKTLLGSATPSLETYYNAKNNKYGLVTLAERFGKTPLPEVVLVDLKEAYFRKCMKGHFSVQLIDAIAEALALNEQVIVFQNRRGFAPVLECITCGHIPQCTNCNVSLTYHKFKNQLRCHYCGYTIAKPTSCHACSSSDLSTKGFGTEQIEMELTSLFPERKIKRMDQDTTRGKYSFEKLIDQFKNREIDILVGTQMLAKGLDFDNVSLVGILNADSLLYHPDFRAFERSFQMMTQVAGRAGRSEKQGKVIIQTYNPMHNTIQQVTHNSYTEMFKEQLYDRQIYKYPPFFRLIRLTLKHRDFDKLKESSLWLYQVLKQQIASPVLGPEEPAINKIRNEYIRTILIKIPAQQSVLSTKKTIQKVLDSFDSVAQYRPVKVTVNVDFY